MNSEQAIRIPIEDTREYRRPRGNNNNRGKWAKWITGVGVGLATIILAAPTVWNWGRELYKIADSPNQTEMLAKHQKQQDEELATIKASQRELREGLNRILSAMRLEPIKELKEKDTQP